MLHKILIALSVVAGAVYLAVPNVAVKGTSVGALAVLAFASRKPILGLALALGSLGDVLLDLDPQRLFVFGLASFLVGHITYTILFIRNRRPRLAAIQIVVAAVVIVYTVGISAWLIPSLGSLVVPVAIYMLAITVMAVCAILCGPLVAAGAILFLLSDSLLAVDKFRTALPYRGKVWQPSQCSRGRRFLELSLPDVPKQNGRLMLYRAPLAMDLGAC